jgi:hypothetical protein
VLLQRLLQHCRSSASCSNFAMTHAAIASLLSRDRCYSNNIATLPQRELQKQCRSALATRVATSSSRCCDASCSSVSLHRCSAVAAYHCRSASLHRCSVAPLLAIVAAAAKLGTSDVSWTSVHRLPSVGPASCYPTILRPTS